MRWIRGEDERILYFKRCFMHCNSTTCWRSSGITSILWSNIEEENARSRLPLSIFHLMLIVRSVPLQHCCLSNSMPTHQTFSRVSMMPTVGVMPNWFTSSSSPWCWTAEINNIRKGNRQLAILVQARHSIVPYQYWKRCFAANMTKLQKKI